MSRKALALSLGAVCLALASGVLLAAGAASRADALSLRNKVAGINRFASTPKRQPLRTPVTENEVNAYLAFDALDQIPSGVVDPAITIAGSGRLSARAVVDLDAVRKQKADRGLFDPLNYATGRLPVTATGVLTTSNGVGRFALEAAQLGPLPVPKLLLQEIVSYYSRTPERPAGISLDDPFTLPSRIREIVVEPGRAVVVQ